MSLRLSLALVPLIVCVAAPSFGKEAHARNGQEAMSSAKGSDGVIRLAQQVRTRPGTVRPPGRAGGAQPPGVSVENSSNDFRPKNGETVEEPFFVDFKEVNLMDVIETVGALTGRNFEVDPSIGNQKVTVISHHPVPAEMAYEVLESILASRGMVMLETLDGNIVKIVPRGQNAEKLEISTELEAPQSGYDNFSIHIVNVQHADANEAAQLLKTVGSQASNISVYPQTNTLVISDTADGLRNMFRLLEVIDIPGHDTSLEIFTLEYTRAEAISQQIQEVLLGTAGGPQRPQTTARTRTTPVRTARPSLSQSQQRPQVVGQREEVLRMVTDERLNALIVVASQGLMGQVRDLIEQLDTPTPYEANNMHYVELLNADAEEVEEALRAITGTTPRQGNQQGGGATAEVQPFEKSVTIARYEQTNALLIVASPQDFKLLKEMIDRLDVPRRQVSIEAIIMEVTINDRFELTVETAGLTGNSLFALNNVINLSNAIAGGPLALSGLGTTLAFLDGTTQIPVPSGIDSSGNLTGTALQTIPNVPLLLKALETVTDVDVLSQPNLLTMDNEEASIVVGQEIPVLSSLSDVNDQSGFVSRSRVVREEVGVKMKVTPQINEGDYISMEINVEVSSPVQSTIGVDPNQVGATFQISEVSNRVVIRDGQTGIIGGLLRESRDRTVSQAPFLGDLPLIGWLFRARSTARSKQNLVILVTPHIIKEGHDLQRITDFQMTQFYKRNLDVIFSKKGFIKKVKKKRRLRNEYRPTERFNPLSPEGEDFSRGNLPR